MTSPNQSLTEAAVAVLSTADAAHKAAASRAVAAAWCDGTIASIGVFTPPDRPARPATPELRRPGDMPRRGAGQSAAGRIALLHAIAHIELNAIDLAWDIVARFASADLPREFFDDWVKVAGEEAKHFTLLSDRLAALGAAYGDLPAHDGLWEAAESTAHDLLARLAVVPLVLEARGLDVTPTMIARMTRYEDHQTAAVLTTIYEDEIGHVAIGMRWFAGECERRGLTPEPTWRALVAEHFKGALKPPFNDDARARAGMGRGYYADAPS
ncbi:MAG TPA: ferritin-like domain-containing protein [Alphaproteobacteria bacterium]|nr:ferritin-like domain-containing protein [Alphaproteobacteria bacterium]